MKHIFIENRRKIKREQVRNDKIKLTNIAVKWLAILIRTLDVLDSNFGP